MPSSKTSPAPFHLPFALTADGGFSRFPSPVSAWGGTALSRSPRSSPTVVEGMPVTATGALLADAPFALTGKQEKAPSPCAGEREGRWSQRVLGIWGGSERGG